MGAFGIFPSSALGTQHGSAAAPLHDIAPRISGTKANKNFSFSLPLCGFCRVGIVRCLLMVRGSAAVGPTSGEADWSFTAYPLSGGLGGWSILRGRWSGKQARRLVTTVRKDSLKERGVWDEKDRSRLMPLTPLRAKRSLPPSAAPATPMTPPASTRSARTCSASLTALRLRLKATSTPRASKKLLPRASPGMVATSTST
jgi:hypothetical protein